MSMSRHEQVDRAFKNGTLQYAGTLTHSTPDDDELHAAQKQSYLYCAMQLADEAYGLEGWYIVRAKETATVFSEASGLDPVSLYVVVIARRDDE